MAGHDHDHSHRHGFADRLRSLFGHDHEHGTALADTGAAGVLASKVSLAGLGVTAALQAALVVFTGSVALLSDTIHNLADGLTAIPLWIAFALGRRASSRRFTFGLGRAEDLAGLVILVAIAASAGVAAWESIRRLIEPQTLEHVPWVIGAGVIGAAGNELVAEYRIRVGRRISSEALIADGQHARADALTSLAVVAAGIGAAVDAAWVDPAAGLIVAAMILVLMRHAGTRIFGRLLDAIDPDLVETARDTASVVEGVESVDHIRMRWHGHRMLITMVAAVDPQLTVSDGHHIAQEISHRLIHAFPFGVDALVHIDPAGDTAAHQLTAHHATISRDPALPRDPRRAPY
jgi:cation diffusion facilitator family transporter